MSAVPLSKLKLRLRRYVRKYVFFNKYILRYIFLARWHSFELTAVFNNTKKIKPNDILLFCTLRNEKIRIPFFLQYYRNLGIRHFFFVDNGSTDGLQALIEAEEDCSLWYTEASYKASNFGMHWINFLLRKYGVGHWCVTVDPDEFLVFPYSEQRNLYELVEFLEGEQRRHLFCLLLDMYADCGVNEAKYAEGQDPLEVAPFFDGTGYVQSPMPQFLDTWIQGGLRRRVYFKHEPHRAPALNKTPLVKWRWFYSYVSSTHVATPRYLNRPHKQSHLSPTGCLLHFKFLAMLDEKASEEMERGEHYDNSIEYRRYKQVLSEENQSQVCDVSVRYADSNQLQALGLMNSGQWF